MKMTNSSRHPGYIAAAVIFSLLLTKSISEWGNHKGVQALNYTAMATQNANVESTSVSAVVVQAPATLEATNLECLVVASVEGNTLITDNLMSEQSKMNRLD